MMNPRTFTRFVFPMLCLMLSSACFWPAGTDTTELSGAVTQTWEALSAFTDQPSEEPPALELEDEPQPEEISSSDTPGLPLLHVTVDTNCRSGPGALYDYLGALLTGELAEVLARGSEPGFWVIENPDNPGTECWVGEQYAVIEGDTSRLPERTPPPPATPVDPDMALGSIAGFVYFDGNNNGHFGDPQDVPLVNALINLLNGDCPGHPPFLHAHVDNAGGYIFSDLPPGRYCVNPDNPTYLPATYEIDIDGQHAVGINFRTIP